MLKRLVLATLALGLVSATAAYANTITDMGSTYTLSYTTAGTNLYDVTLVIDTSAFANGNLSDPHFMDDVSLKLVPKTSDYSSISVLSAPTGYASTVTDGGVSAGGCHANNTNGKFCLAYTGSGLGEATDNAADVYTFVFQVGDLNGLGGAGGLLTGSGDDGPSIQVNYQYYGKNDSVKNGGITSQNITLTPGSTTTVTPEPASIALLGTALLGMALLARKFGMSS